MLGVSARSGRAGCEAETGNTTGLAEGGRRRRENVNTW